MKIGGIGKGNNQQRFEVKKVLSGKSVFPSLTYHLQSAQFITNAKGEQYEHIEYTPYGELWTYKSKTAMLFLTTYNNFLAKQPAGLIEETAPGIDKLPFRFTGKELDEETGLYYYGARYLDPKYSRWLSGDPAVGEYISYPQRSTSGGIYNTINLNVYHYGMNNPLRYVDPDGWDNYLIIACFQGGGDENVGTTFIDAANTRKNDIEKSSSFNAKTDTINVVSIDSIEELKDLLASGNIDQLDVFSHGGERHLVIGSGEGKGKRELLYEGDLNSMNRDAFNDGARINFFGCKTASESSLNFLQKFFGKRTIADYFAQYFKGVTVTGFTGGALAAPMPNAKPDPSFVHKKGDPVWFITWGSIRTYKYEK